MSSSDAAWDIYAEQMARMMFGVGLWRPSPTYGYRKIRVGHVGYIRMGRFRLLFDANGPIGDRIPGRDVPEGFVPLPTECTQVVEEDSRPPEPLYTESSKAVGADIQATSGLALAPIGGVFSFHSSKAKGALLITQDWIKWTDSDRERLFELYIRKYHQLWVNFARDRGHQVTLEDIILVTGHDTTREYAMAAFANNNSALRMAFKAGYEGIATASASVWGSWDASPVVHRTCGPPGSLPRSSGLLSPSLNSPSALSESSSQQSLTDEASTEEFNQCVFVRGFRMRRRFGLVLTVLKAAAGYHDLGGGDRGQDASGQVLAQQSDSNSNVATVNISQELTEEHLVSHDEDGDQMPEPQVTPFVDPLEPVFNYIFENCSADLAIAHDLDVLHLAKSAGVDFFEDVSTLLSIAPPSIKVGDDGIGQLAFDCVEVPEVPMQEMEAIAEREGHAETEVTPDIISTIQPPQDMSEHSEDHRIRENETFTEPLGAFDDIPRELERLPDQQVANVQSAATQNAPLHNVQQSIHSVDDLAQLSRPYRRESYGHNFKPSKFLDAFHRFKHTSEELPGSSIPQPTFTATFSGQNLNLLCKHETLLTLSIQEISIRACGSHATLDRSSITNLGDISALFAVSYQRITKGRTATVVISLDFSTARQLKLVSTTHLTAEVETNLNIFLRKYMEYLHSQCGEMQFEFSLSDDSQVGYDLQRQFVHVEDIHADMIHSLRSRTINAYLAKRWRRAVRPKHPRDQLLSSLSEISSSWAVNTVIQDHFIIRFDAPEVKVLCQHSVILFVTMEDVTFFDDDSTFTRVYHGLRLAFLVNAYKEVNESKTVKIQLDTSRFLDSHSRWMGAEADSDHLSSPSKLVEFLQKDYFQILSRLSLDVIYSGPSTEEYTPSKLPQYLPTATLTTEEFTAQRIQIEAEDGYGFDQIMTLSEDAINLLFYNSWWEACNRKTDDLLSTFTSAQFAATFGPPTIRLLSNYRAVIWLPMNRGIIRRVSRGDSSHDVRQYHDSSDEFTEKNNDNYVCKDACYFAFEVDLNVSEDRTLPIPYARRQKLYQSDISLHLAGNEKSYHLKHLLFDVRNAEFIPELSLTTALGVGRGGVDKLEIIVRHLTEYMTRLSDEGYNIIYTVPVWTNPSDLFSPTLTDFKYQVVTKTDITRQNCSRSRGVDEAPVVLILGIHAFRPLPLTIVPWYDGWVMRDKEHRTISTVYLSQKAFLQPLLLPLMKMINRKTTIVPKALQMVNGVWDFDVGSFDNNIRWSGQACDWRRDDGSAYDGNSLRYTWDYSDELSRKQMDPVTLMQEEAVISCRTSNELIIPTTCKPDCLEMRLLGTSVVTISGKGNIAWSKQSSGYWSGALRIIPGPKGFQADFADRIQPSYTLVELEGDCPFDLVRLHRECLGRRLRTDDIVMAARMLQSQCKFLSPGLRNYVISSPMIRPAGGIVLQVYAEDVNPATSRQVSRLEERMPEMQDSPATANAQLRLPSMPPKGWQGAIMTNDKGKSAASANHQFWKAPSMQGAKSSPPLSKGHSMIYPRGIASGLFRNVFPPGQTSLTQSPPPTYGAVLRSDAEELGLELLDFLRLRDPARS